MSSVATLRDDLNSLATDTEATAIDLATGKVDITTQRDGVEALLDESTTGTEVLQKYEAALTAVEEAIARLGEASIAARDYATQIMQ